MGFNEKVHAYIAAKYYVYLTERFQEKGKAAFTHGTQYHAGQRGRRMAQRAIRDGQPLTFATYRKYGEWSNTEETKAMGCANVAEIESYAPDYRIRIDVCPWGTQFKEMGLKDAGIAYCTPLDAAIVRGFNPDIHFECFQTIHEHPFCVQGVTNANLDPNADATPDPENQRPFEYHCANSYWSYREVCCSIFGEEGKKVAEQVLEDFGKDYGEEMKKTLLSYEHTNFNIIDG